MDAERVRYVPVISCAHASLVFLRSFSRVQRWGMSVQSIRFARVCVEESMKHAFRRKTFGKKLIEHPVIRFKLAQMARQVESAHAWLENITSVETNRCAS
jgi:alkylation response protein AidB-like acyl-CoA dehydrogenase